MINSSTFNSDWEYDDVEYAVGSRVKLASKYAPLGAIPLGLIFSGGVSVFSGSWLPVITYTIPFFIYCTVHYSTRERFLGDAAWAITLNMIGVSFAFTYPSFIVLVTGAHTFLSLTTAWGLTGALFIGGYLYTAYYYHQKQRAWEEKRTSNFRFALNPDTRTFRFDEGFNFGTVDSLGWDDYLFFAVLSLSPIGASFLGGLIYESTLRLPLAVTSGICAPLLLSMLRFEVASALVTIQKIREYEKEHDVQIRPR
jgi:hypothetical protein